jgi:hypothetical protein
MTLALMAGDTRKSNSGGSHKGSVMARKAGFGIHKMGYPSAKTTQRVPKQSSRVKVAPNSRGKVNKGARKMGAR